MRPHLDALIAARRAAIAAGDEVPDDVLTRLLQHSPDEGGLHDIAIRHNLIGLIAGWIPTVSKAFAVAIEELLSRPAELERAQQAARDGDRELVAAYVFEALRFRPQTWALLRICGKKQTVAADTDRATEIPEGAKVLVATQSAMFDERVVDRATRVQSRPPMERLPALRPRAAHLLRPPDQPRTYPRARHGAAGRPADHPCSRHRRQAAVRRPLPLESRGLALRLR